MNDRENITETNLDYLKDSHKKIAKRHIYIYLMKQIPIL